MPATTLPLDEFVAPSLRRRLACWLYEALILFALMMVTVLLESIVALGLPAFNQPVLLQACSFVVFGAYFAYFWSRGQTLAMKTWRIQLVDPHGQRITALRALARYALAWVWVLPLALQLTPWRLPLAEMAVLQAGWVCIWALLSRLQPQRQFLHDVAAGTRLIEA